MNKNKIKLRQCSNSLLENVIDLNLSLFPELRYIQNLWALNIIDQTMTIQSESYVIDRFQEEPYDTIIRILPKIMDLINNKFPKNAKVTDKLRRANIFNYLEQLGIARKTDNFKLELIKK